MVTNHGTHIPTCVCRPWTKPYTACSNVERSRIPLQQGISRGYHCLVSSESGVNCQHDFLVYTSTHAQVTGGTLTHARSPSLVTPQPVYIREPSLSFPRHAVPSSVLSETDCAVRRCEAGGCWVLPSPHISLRTSVLLVLVLVRYLSCLSFPRQTCHSECPCSPVGETFCCPQTHERSQLLYCCLYHLVQRLHMCALVIYSV